MTEPQNLNDFKRIWQGQSTEDTKLTLEQVREKARSYQSQKRVGGLISLPISIFLTILFSRTMVRAWMEHRPEGETLIPILVGLWLIHRSIMWIGSRKLAPNAGFRTSLEVYRAHFEQVRALIPWIWGSMIAIMVATTIGAINLWMQSPVFHAWDVAQFGLAYALIGVIIYLGVRYKYRQIDQALHMVEGLDRDIDL
jgi:hypothetical protein